MYVLIRYGIAAPGVHVRTPRCELGKMSKSAERDRDHEYGDDCNRSALPTLFSFSGKKRQQNKAKNYSGRADEKEWRLKRWRKKREQSIEAKEKVIWFGRSLDDCRIGLPGRPKRAKVVSACANCQDDKCREKHVFPNCIRDEGCALFPG